MTILKYHLQFDKNMRFKLIPIGIFLHSFYIDGMFYVD